MYSCGKRRKSKTSSKLRTIDLLDEKLQNMCLNIPEKDKHNLASGINRATTPPIIGGLKEVLSYDVVTTASLQKPKKRQLLYSLIIALPPGEEVLRVPCFSLLGIPFLKFSLACVIVLIQW